jgi:hypothetical protein
VLPRKTLALGPVRVRAQGLGPGPCRPLCRAVLEETAAAACNGSRTTFYTFYRRRIVAIPQYKLPIAQSVASIAMQIAANPGNTLLMLNGMFH